MSIIKEKLLSALGDRRQQITERDVLRVSGQIPLSQGGNDFSTARQLVLEWVKERSGGTLPKEAWDFEDFRTDLAGRNTECLSQQFDGLAIWAVRAEDPDKNVAGRNWKTEVVLTKEQSNRVRFSLRLRVSSHLADQEFTPASPKLVSSLIQSVGLRLGGHTCNLKPLSVNDHTSYDLFIEHLQSPGRKTPLVVQSYIPNQPMIATEPLCRRLAGIAHVYSLSPGFARKLSDEIGKELSVFDGGIRVYAPDFEKSDEPSIHRLFLRRFIQQGENHKVVARHIAQDVAALGMRTNQIGKEVLSFSDVSAALHKHRSQERDAALSTGESENSDALIESLKNQVQSLEAQVNDAKEMEAVALEENDILLKRAEEAEARARNVTIQIQYLKANSQKPKEVAESRVSRPSGWGDFAKWVEREFAGQIVLTGAAKREIKKAQFTKIDLACECIEWLATEGISTRISGADGTSTREAQVADGAIHAHCGGDAYDFDWEGQKHTADWHIKGSSSRDPKHCLRIYFAWDDHSQQIIVSHMPSHRTTSMS